MPYSPLKHYTFSRFLSSFCKPLFSTVSRLKFVKNYQTMYNRKIYILILTSIMQTQNKIYIGLAAIVMIASIAILSQSESSQKVQGNIAGRMTSIKSQTLKTVDAFDAYINGSTGLTFNTDKQQIDIAKSIICISFNSSFATNNVNISLPMILSIADTANSKTYKLDTKTLNLSTADIIAKTVSDVTNYSYCEPTILSFPLKSDTTLTAGQSYTATLTLDPDNLYKEQDTSKKSKEDNNTLNGTFMFDIPTKYKPDLIATNIAISSDKNVSWQVCDKNFANSKKYYTGKTFNTSILLGNTNTSAYQYKAYTLEESKLNAVSINDTSLTCFWTNAMSFANYSSLAFKTGETVTATIQADIINSKDTSSSPNGYIIESDEKNTFTKSITW